MPGCALPVSRLFSSLLNNRGKMLPPKSIGIPREYRNWPAFQCIDLTDNSEQLITY